MPVPRQGKVARAAATLRVRVLGGFAVSVGDRPIPDSAWASRKAQQLVKLLALAPAHRLARDQVLDALWPDQDPAALAATFRQTCYLARRALALPDTLTLRDGFVSLAPPGRCQVDSVAFEAAAAAARRTGTADAYAAALALYAGELLPEDRYADWALLPAERLRALATALRHELAALREAAGDSPAAEALWRQILTDEPADEAAHVGLMRLYARQGQRQRAARQYHTLHRRLRDDLALAPDPATQRLYAAILGGQFPAEEAPAVPTPAAPAPLPPHALPPALTGLVGRGAEIAAVRTLLGGEARLVTLTGAGGCGKTRLARAVAEAVLPAYPDGVWWVELAPLADGALVADTAAQVLGVRPRPGQPALAALTAALRDRTLLLVLDNAEHLRAACADLALALLGACPGVRALATSRAALRAVGEQTWRVPSLPVPAPDSGTPGPADLAALAENDAVRLFVARGRLARADFALTPGNAAAVAAVCRRVEGLPLALELAAARISVLEPGQLAARLDDALALLSGGAHGLPDRQRTLRATLDWSWTLLPESEQRLLEQLAVFAGGWTLDAAEAVCGGAGTDVLAGLAGLVEHSLVQVAPSEAAEPRYRLLEPTRQYARGRLAAGGAEATLREAHARHFLALAEQAEPRLVGPTELYWLDALQIELGNLRAALGWWAAQRQGERGLRLAGALTRLWQRTEHCREGWFWLTDAFATLDAPAAIRAKAALGVAILGQMTGRYAEGMAQGRLSLALYRELGLLREQALALNYLGTQETLADQHDRAAAYLEEARQLAIRSGDRFATALVLGNIASLADKQGDLATSDRLNTTVAPLLRELGSARFLQAFLINRATTKHLLGQHRTALALVREGLTHGQQARDFLSLLYGLALWAALACEAGQPPLAARMLGAIQAEYQRNLSLISPGALARVDPVAAATRAALGEEAYSAAYADGQILALDAAIAEALAPDALRPDALHDKPSS